MVMRLEERRVKILGTGIYLPPQIVTAEEIDRKIGTQPGWTQRKVGVRKRYFVDQETNSQMGALAAKEAIASANLQLTDIDLIVSASGTTEQAIPCTASLIYKELAPQHQGIPAFDLDSTCLSFITALDHLSYLIEAKRYRYILLVSTEIASVELNWHHKESSALFGDGAAAVVIGPAEGGTSKILASRMETYHQGAHLSEIRGGGTKYHPRTYQGDLNLNDFLFDMDGQALYRMSAQHLPRFLQRLLQSANLTLQNIDMVIPHQASPAAMRLIQKRLQIADEQMFSYVDQYGNMIAASVPLGIHLATKQKKIKRGDYLLLLGTSAGLSLGGVLLVY